MILVFSTLAVCHSLTETFFKGLDQSGLATTIALSISHLPHDLHGMFWGNIGLIGGNIKFPGFRTRLYVFGDFVIV
jgi:actin-related protein